MPVEPCQRCRPSVRGRSRWGCAMTEGAAHGLRYLSLSRAGDDRWPDARSGRYAFLMHSELEQLKAGIASLESQRRALGDGVVDLAVAPLRAKLAALASTTKPAEAAQKLKQVTILFLDVVGSTTLS